MKNLTLAAVAAIFVTQSAVADTISGKITFAKRAPFAGALYVKEQGQGNNSAQMDQSNKVFDKKIVAVGQGGTITFNNSDDFQHNIFADDPNSGAQFDVGLMDPGNESALEVNWQEHTLTRIGCKIHPRMRSYILNVPTEQYQLFEFDSKVLEYDIAMNDVRSAHSDFVLTMPNYDDVAFTLAAGEQKTVDLMARGQVAGQLTVARQ